ncbi:MAG TPA: sigma-70 family RNA polymerase sigma factor [Thermoanaerobaculia bacterium]|nr:sigma-70 family RNA polymerase sigma factor [Thermoanaerobaculia bacterium]
MFPTTHRSLVLALASGAPEERARAFETLLAVYWKPVYKYLRVRWSRTREEAEDLTQGFFARAFEKESLVSYDAGRASFRAFLRTLLDRYASNERKAALRQKRGGGGTHLDFDSAEQEIGREPAASANPEEYFHQEWVRSVFSLAVDRLRASCEGRGRSKHFSLFEAYDLEDDQRVSYADLASRFGLTETAVTNHLASVRREFREIVLDTLREATATESEFRSEARALLGVTP